ncbi:hypothetical protein ACYUJ6_09645 [Clostridium sp. JNZ X4-2]
MTFTSILFQKNDAAINRGSQEVPSYFKDLNIEQIIDTIISGMQKYNLKPFFLQPLHNEDTIYYRQEVMQDLECEALFKKIKAFSGYIYDIAAEMQKISEYLTKPDEYDDELTLTPKVEQAFQRFSCDDTKCYTQSISDKPYAEHIGAGVLNLVAELYPNIFLDLNNYCIKNSDVVREFYNIATEGIKKKREFCWETFGTYTSVNIIIQMIFIPFIVSILKRNKLIP